MRVHKLLGWFAAPLLAAGLSAAAGDSRLPDAARNQDRETVRRLLEQHVDVNSRQPDGATALHWAMHWNDLETARLLIRAGARSDAVNEYGVTALSLACTNGSRDAVALLLDAGANPNLALPSGETPLMTAARTGSVDVVQALLARGADPNAREHSDAQTALMWAVSEKHPEVARALIARGAEVRARSTRGFTALLFAARQGDLASARQLLEHGADVNETAADRLSPLVVASVRGQAALAMFLLEHGADPNAAGAGFTALHWASGSWETELTGPRGIAVERDEEWRALRGVQSGKIELIKALLAHGADPNARITRPPLRVGFTRGGLNLVGAPPFLVAAAAADAELMRLLAASGADPRLMTNENTTALMAAAGVGRVTVESSVSEMAALEAVKAALALGSDDVNAANAAGDTALHGAASMRSLPLIQFLIDRGARVDVKNRRGQTPAAVARGSAVADLLEQK
jgi:ankyrin repeat protein